LENTDIKIKNEERSARKIPTKDRIKSIKSMVDENGSVPIDQIAVTWLIDPSYARRLAKFATKIYSDLVYESETDTIRKL
jgi:uncharacterized protein (UPF0297 family)